MKILFPLFAAFIIYSCSNSKKEKETHVPMEQKEIIAVDTTLVTDSTWGLINANSDFTGLQAAYGAANIKDERICGAECVDSVDVTIVFPGSIKEFIVYWEDSAYHKQIGMIRGYTPSAPYHTSGGLKIGTTLKELLQMNGKPIAFSGFDWDYGGGVISLNHGALENSAVHFTLGMSENTTSDDTVEGDRELNSNMPAVKKLEDKILVSEMMVSFNR